MKYFIYCRKSTEAEDRQILSIESQLTTLRRSFDGHPDIQICEVVEEAYSAKSPGRPLFNDMMSRIEAGEASGIIAWAPDRLARNSVDGGRIIYLLDRNVLRDIKFATYTFENNSQGKFMLQIMFGQSKYYSDALSDNVKRGLRTKVEKGWRPTNAPLGYLNDRTTSTIIKDPERCAFVRQMFVLVLAGTSVRRVCDIAREEWCFRTPKRKRIGGKPLPLGSVYRILKDPFYAGILLWHGKAYPAAHEPLVSLEEFERVQKWLSQPEKPRPQRHHFPFTGMIRCGECGMLVTAETKINRYGSRYTYYHCSKRKPNYRCGQPCLRAESLERQIVGFLGRLTMPASVHDWALRQLEKARTEDGSLFTDRKASIQNALVEGERAIKNLMSLRLRDLIDDDEFARERSELDRKNLLLTDTLRRLDDTEETFEPAEVLISFSNRAVSWFQAGDIDAKRMIFNCVGSNPTLMNRFLNVTAKFPFNLTPKNDSILGMRGFCKDIRTLYAKNDEEFLKTLQAIRELEIRFGVRPADEAVRQRRTRRLAA